MSEHPQQWLEWSSLAGGSGWASGWARVRAGALLSEWVVMEQGSTLKTVTYTSTGWK